MQALIEICQEEGVIMFPESAKKLAAEVALDKAIKYVSKNPEQNLITIMKFLEKLASLPEHKKMVAVVKDKFENNPAIMEQTKRVASNPRMLNNLINSWILKGTFWGRPRRDKVASELGVMVPAALLIDPTSGCNLSCEGCWAGEYNKSDHLDAELFSRIISEAKELGIHWIVLSGGEPFVYPKLLEVVGEHSDSFFMAYTNGTLIDEKVADRLAELGNLSPSFSLEGWKEQTDARRGAGTFEKVTHAMDLLRERGVFFGSSITAMRYNVEEIMSEEFIDFLVDKGALYSWIFHYVPVGSDPDVDLMLTPEQRLWLVQKRKELRSVKPIFIADFWNDGYYTSGCIAGGRQYFHINAAGDVEPCAFVHFAVDNIKNKSLREVLQNPLFKSFQDRVPFNENFLAPCPIIDAPQALREIAEEVNVRPTHKGADAVLEGKIASYLDELSKSWQEKIDGRDQESGR